AEKAFDIFIDSSNKYFDLIEDITDKDIRKTLINNVTINMKEKEAKDYNTINNVCFAKLLMLFSLIIPGYEI
ncbi:12376_t:CDS:2, partial [Funneliformis mosseae]